MKNVVEEEVEKVIIMNKQEDVEVESVKVSDGDKIGIDEIKDRELIGRGKKVEIREIKEGREVMNKER